MIIINDVIRGALRRGNKAPYSAVIEFTLPQDSTQQYFAMSDLQTPPEAATSVVVAETQYLLLENYRGQYYPTNASEFPVQISLDGKHLVFFERPRSSDYAEVLPRAIMFQDGRLFINTQFKRDRSYLTTLAPDLAEMNWVFKAREYWDLFGKDTKITTTIGDQLA